MKRILIVLMSVFVLSACGGSSSNDDGVTAINQSEPATFTGTYNYDYLRLTYHSPQQQIITNDMFSFFRGEVAINAESTGILRVINKLQAEINGTSVLDLYADANNILATTAEFSCTAYQLAVIDNDEISVDFTGCSDNGYSYDIYMELIKVADTFTELTDASYK